MPKNREGYCIPKQLDIEVTAACNLACKGCPRQVDLNKHMSLELYGSIVDRAKIEMPDTTIVMWLNGEPLLHPHYYEMVKYTTNANIQCNVTTNGMIWNPRLFELIVQENSCYQIMFSLDGLPAAWSRSIEVARPGSDRVIILENIRSFREMKVNAGNNIDMGIKIVRRGQDWEEVERYISHWLHVPGIDFVCVGDLLTEHNEKSMRIFPCQYSDNAFMIIKYDGRITYCSYNDGMVNVVENRAGYLDMTTPLIELYNSEEMMSFREDQRKGIFTEVCKHCGFSYSGFGFKGVVTFRDPKLDLPKVYYHRDYYNQFFSLVEKGRPDDYYLAQGRQDEGEV